MSRKIIKQLKTLQRITPRSEWQAACKEVLLSQVASQGMGTSRPGTFAGIVVYTRTVLSGAYQYTLGAVVAHPAAMALTALTILFGGSVATLGARHSLPGDTLHSVKKTTENIQVAIAFPDQKAELQMQQVETRLEELDAISKQSISDEEKAAKVESLVSDVTSTLTSAGQYLEDIKSSQDSKRVAQVANAVSQKAVRVSEVLSKTKQALSKPVKHNTAPKVKEALAQANTTTTKALAVVIEKNGSSATPEEIKNNIQDRIKQAEEHVKTLDQVVKIASSTKGVDATQVAKATQDSKEATDKLNIAKKSLEKNDLSLALMSLDESYKLVVDAQESAEAIIITTPETKDEEIKEGDKKEETKIPTPEKQESETPLADPTSP
ncbi:MAG: DUF5667 domain-containing protein [Patescibacteria group bacterium]